jgi:TonB family protein
MSTLIHNDRLVSTSGTVIFHVLGLFLLFMLAKSCGTGGGGGNNGMGYSGLMEMDVAGMGNDIDGWGENPQQDAPVENTVTEPVIEENNAITEDSPTNDAPVVNDKPKDKPTTKPKDVITKPKEETKPKVSGGLNNALGGLSKGGSGNTSGTGNQGTKDGTIDGKGVLGGGGSAGTGGGQGGGNGTGTGTGNGPGSGSGSGGGFKDYTLAGRSIRTAPTLSEVAPDEGIVMVDIWVDAAGNVTKAVANAAKSNTSNSQLYTLAEKAAKKAKFNAVGSGEQKGTIKITFKLH